MNFFCRIFGHTWVAITDNPKISWNADEAGLLLNATPAGETRFFDECARCRERREIVPARRFATALNTAAPKS